MSRKSRRIFIIVLAAMSLAATALILSLPALFGAPEPGQVWLAAALGLLTAVLATAVLLLRPQRRDSGA